MIRRFAPIWIAAIVFLAGCGSSVESGTAERIDTPAGMIEYLQEQNLPAVRSIEVWPNKYGQGLIITTRHYEIYTTLLEPLMLSQVPGFIESAYRAYNNQMPEPIEIKTRFKIYLFADRSQWEDFTKGFTGSQAPLYCKIKSGAYYLNGACVAYNIGRERTFAVLGHEGWHQFNSRCFKFRLPSWLNEGIAMLFETYRSERGLFYFEPGRNFYRLGSLKKTLITNKMFGLNELVGMNPGEVVDTSDEAVMAFYSQTYALVRFLREEDYGKRLGNYHQLLLDGLRGNWPLGAVGKRIAADRNIPMTVGWNRAIGTLLFKQYISEDFDKIEDEYTTFCRKIVYHVRIR